VGIALVPNLLNETPADRYEARMNDILNFGDEWWGAYDQKALRIVLATCYLHLFTNEKPVWLWLMQPSTKLDTAIGIALGRLLFCPAAGTIANELKDQTSADRSLWVLAEMSGIFHRPPAEIEVSLRQLADMERGELEWHPRGIELDGRQGPQEPFVWNGRVTVIASAHILDRMQYVRAANTWPICQNTFVNVRMNGAKRSAELRDKWHRFDPAVDRRGTFKKFGAQSVEEWVVSELRLRLINLFDFDFRNRSHRVSVPPGFFDPLTYLATVVGELRSGFDQDELLSKGMRVARAHARMMGKPHVDSEDLALSRKILLDAIPPPSIEVLKALPMDGWWTLQQVADSVQTKPQRVESAVRRLLQSGSITGKRGYLMTARKNPTNQRYFRTSPELAAALMAAFPDS
jgi:hypothetical protein